MFQNILKDVVSATNPGLNLWLWRWQISTPSSNIHQGYSNSVEQKTLVCMIFFVQANTQLLHLLLDGIFTYIYQHLPKM